MIRSAPEQLAREIEVRVRALATALRKSGGREQSAADLAKVAAAASRLGEMWQARAGGASEALDEEAARKARHDLRTPVSHMMGYLELAEETLQEIQSPGVEVKAWLVEIGRLRARVDELRVALEAGMRAWAHERPSSPPASRPPGRRGRGGARVLAVDDDGENRNLLRRHLERQGHEIETAEGGELALRLARETPPDLVLLDVMMPGLDGYETLRRLKSDERLARVPVIMLSGLDHAETIVRCLEAGADDHIPKPFEPAILSARVESALERKRLGDREREHLAQLLAAKRRADAFIDYVVPMGARLAAQTDTPTLLREIVEVARRFTGADGGTLYLRREDASLQAVVQVVESRGLDRSSGDPIEDLAPSPSAQLAARSGRSQRIDDTGDASVDAPRSIFALPLRGVDDELRGVLELTDARAGEGADAATPVAFDPARETALEALGRLAAVALARNAHEQSLRRRIADLEVQIDEGARAREVAVITDNDYFRELRAKATRLRARGRSQPGQPSPSAGAKTKDEVDDGPR